MEPFRHSVDFVRDFARELAPRTAKTSSESLKRRFKRLRDRMFFILQCAISAGAAWWIATILLDQPTPYLAPVAAIICLGMTFGQRYRRVVEVTVGVAVGVLIGSAFAEVFGAGPWQIIVVATLSMSVAVLLGGGVLIVTQAAVQGIVVITLIAHPGAGFGRWVDALVGAAVAIAATLIAPASPVGKPRVLAANMLAELSEILNDATKALRTSDGELATATLRRARSTEESLSAFQAAAAEGLAVVRYSLLRRRHKSGVQEIADLAAPIDRAMRNTRVLARRIRVTVLRAEAPTPGLTDVLAELADVARQFVAPIFQDTSTVKVQAELVKVALMTNGLPLGPSLSSAVILAQVRSIVVDLLELTGLTYDEARKVFGLSEDDDEFDEEKSR